MLLQTKESEDRKRRIEYEDNNTVENLMYNKIILKKYRYDGKQFVLVNGIIGDKINKLWRLSFVNDKNEIYAYEHNVRYHEFKEYIADAKYVTKIYDKKHYKDDFDNKNVKEGEEFYDILMME